MKGLFTISSYFVTLLSCISQYIPHFESTSNTALLRLKLASRFASWIVKAAHLRMLVTKIYWHREANHVQNTTVFSRSEGYRSESDIEAEEAFDVDSDGSEGSSSRAPVTINATTTPAKNTSTPQIGNKTGTCRVVFFQNIIRSWKSTTLWFWLTTASFRWAL